MVQPTGDEQYPCQFDCAGIFARKAAAKVLWEDGLRVRKDGITALQRAIVEEGRVFYPSKILNNEWVPDLGKIEK